MPRIQTDAIGIPNHKLQKNLKLDGKYISNDGGDEGIYISDVGIVSIRSTGNSDKTILRLHDSQAPAQYTDIRYTDSDDSLGFYRAAGSLSNIAMGETESIAYEGRFDSLTSSHSNMSHAINFIPNVKENNNGNAAGKPRMYFSGDEYGTTSPVIGVVNTFATGSGISRFMELVETYNPTTGSVDYHFLSLKPTINQNQSSGDADGNYTGIFLNVTETALGGSDNKLMDLQVGGSSKFKIKNTGDTTINGGALLDYNLASPGTVNKTALDVDVDITGAQASTFSIVGLSQNIASTAATGGFQMAIGINNIITNQLTMDSGVALTYGLNNSAQANTNGASQCVGIINLATGGDVNTGFIQTVTNGGIDIQLQSSADAGDKFTIATGDHGATTIATIDDDNNQAASLTFDIQGDILFSADNDSGASTGICTVDATNSSFVLLADKKIMLGNTGEYIVGDGTNMVMASSGNLLITTSANSGTGALSFASGAEMNLGSDTGVFNFRDDGDADDAFKITVAGDTGATTLETLSEDTDGHLTLDADGELNLDAGLTDDDFSGILLKQSGTTFGSLSAHHGASIFLLAENAGASLVDYFKIKCEANGASTIETVDDAGADAHLSVVADGHVEFDGCGVGFDLVTPTYNASDTDVSFITGNKQFVTFGSGNITDLNLIFPKTSGNFTLLLKQDGTGSRTVTNYKVWDVVNSDAASGSATVKFAGGSNPTLTTDANHVDIISFFWDADNEIAYGVASLDFQF